MIFLTVRHLDLKNRYLIYKPFLKFYIFQKGYIFIKNIFIVLSCKVFYNVIVFNKLYIIQYSLFILRAKSTYHIPLRQQKPGLDVSEIEKNWHI